MPMMEHALKADFTIDRRRSSKRNTMNTVLPQALIDAYRSTHYKVAEGSEQFVLRVDEFSSAFIDLYLLTDQSSALFITAFHP